MDSERETDEDSGLTQKCPKCQNNISFCVLKKHLASCASSRPSPPSTVSIPPEEQVEESDTLNDPDLTHSHTPNDVHEGGSRNSDIYLTVFELNRTTLTHQAVCDICVQLTGKNIIYCK
ncbi:uncharacterized protein LOC117103039 [Anneissia japonica]|uniref:uncharacterized protein LOC117103039 n=1 Tax=Anneissia japonica TaxID=1529436 RepID=UPI001425B6C7|nr:uncharacterized protein LOC117103039 [Anneissia japonica]